MYKDERNAYKSHYGDRQCNLRLLLFREVAKKVAIMLGLCLATISVCHAMQQPWHRRQSLLDAAMGASHTDSLFIDPKNQPLLAKIQSPNNTNEEQPNTQHADNQENKVDPRFNNVYKSFYLDRKSTSELLQDAIPENQSTSKQNNPKEVSHSENEEKQLSSPLLQNEPKQDIKEENGGDNNKNNAFVLSEELRTSDSDEDGQARHNSSEPLLNEIQAVFEENNHDDNASPISQLSLAFPSNAHGGKSDNDKEEKISSPLNQQKKNNRKLSKSGDGREQESNDDNDQLSNHSNTDSKKKRQRSFPKKVSRGSTKSDVIQKILQTRLNDLKDGNSLNLSIDFEQIKEENNNNAKTNSITSVAQPLSFPQEQTTDNKNIDSGQIRRGNNLEMNNNTQTNSITSVAQPLAFPQEQPNDNKNVDLQQFTFGAIIGVLMIVAVYYIYVRYLAAKKSNT